LAALAALIAVGLLAPAGGAAGPIAGDAPVALMPAGPPHGAAATLAVVAAALVPVLFSYGGWQQTNFVAGELRDPRRTLPRALVLGVLVVVAVYLGANVAYLRTLGLVGLAASTAPAADTMGAAVGPVGRTLIAAGIAAS